jgi:hypothetical protein
VGSVRELEWKFRLGKRETVDMGGFINLYDSELKF